MDSESTAHAKYLILSHLIFVWKYHKRLLVACGQEMKRIFEEIATNSDFTCSVLEVDRDHLYGLVSFLDLDEIPVYDPDNTEERVFNGKRIGQRNRLYRAKDRRIICADVNGAYNILRKLRSLMHFRM